MNKYDVIIIGAGPAGAFTALEMIKKKSNKKILIIEQGQPVEKRFCPITKTQGCLNCKPCCHIMSGFAGSGAYSDSKLTKYDTNSEEVLVGGDLPYLIGHKVVKDLINYTDEIYLDFGAEKELVGIERMDEIEILRSKFKRNQLDLINSPVRHLGTEKSRELYGRIQEFLLSNGIEILFNTKVDDLIIQENKIKGVITEKGDFMSNTVVAAIGRKGSSWLKDMCLKHSIKNKVGTVDVGIRYELSDKVMSQINDLLYEMKLYGKPMPYGDKVRSFCQNPSGEVVLYKLDDEITLCNGHSFKEKKSHNTNLAILVSMNFTSPFNDPLLYGRNIAQNANVLAGNGVLVQRYGDILRGKRTWENEFLGNSVEPTLKHAVAGDITNALPYRVVQNIVEYIRMVDKVIPGFGHPDNLLYAPEVKFYSNLMDVSTDLETNISGLYAIGDGSGLSRGLMVSSCSGVYVARIILNKNK